MQETQVDKSHINFYNYENIDEDPYRANKTCSFGEKRVQQSRKIRTTEFFSQFLEYQDSDAMEKSKDSYVENSSTGAVFSIESLMEELRIKSLNVDRNQNKY